ncbi:hypothetical protein [Flagellimonas meridianipacifica]|uniref:Uncharacterized protein n=1 Tax=Flagellimonas meridianipacifica TaxID=1080225 RepID=A0A2T0MGJ0_9FLAO|nr:hypothetical protein [Allomuricauda pacifica]PRX56646.1 hypothetical protein CLV81_0643 [Allomuricauda pacifica]
MLNKSNIPLGCVVYSESIHGIEAEWIFKRKDTIERGKGIGIRLTEVNKKRRYEGEFEITYSDTDGNTSPKLYLIISFESGYYTLTWSNNEKITDIGIGIERDNKLLVSYTKAI